MKITENDRQNIQEEIKKLLLDIKEDPMREGLKDTPKRVAKYYAEFLNPPEFNMTTFDADGYDEMIIQRNINFFSLCEHHLLPFFGVGHIAYLPDEKIVGLSKLSRTLEYFSRRLQNQERITKQVSDYLNKHLEPKGVAVVLEARHLCMEMRGVRKFNSPTTTSSMTGCFENHSAKMEILDIISL